MTRVLGAVACGAAYTVATYFVAGWVGHTFGMTAEIVAACPLVLGGIIVGRFVGRSVGLPK